MLALLIESQPGAFGPMDFLYDTNADDIMVAVDVREYKGPINPQLSEAQVLVCYPDDFAWIFSLTGEQPDHYGYLRMFNYKDYCSWINRNSI